MKQFIFICALLACIACNKDENSNQSGKSVDIYLIDDYKTVDGSDEIVHESVQLSSQKLLSYSELTSYSSAEYTFTLSDSAAARIDIEAIHTSPFAVTVDNEIIYTGYFWAGFSSSICNWIVIDPLSLVTNNKLRVKLGYPGLMDGVVIPDKRNDTRITETFKKDNKLFD